MCNMENNASFLSNSVKNLIYKTDRTIKWSLMDADLTTKLLPIHMLYPLEGWLCVYPHICVLHIYKNSTSLKS